MHTAAEMDPGRRGEREAWEARVAREAWEASEARGSRGERRERGDGEQPAHSSAFGESFRDCSTRLAAVHQRQVVTCTRTCT